MDVSNHLRSPCHQGVGRCRLVCAAPGAAPRRPRPALARRKVLEPKELAIEGAVFGGLALWVLLLGLSHTQGGVDVAPGPQLAAGVGTAVFFLRNSKKVALPRALGLAGLGLVAGAVVGSAVEGASLHAGGGFRSQLAEPPCLRSLPRALTGLVCSERSRLRASLARLAAG